MITVSEATSIILQNLWKGTHEEVSLLQSINRILAEDILADRDFPPFNRVTMDGIAISQESFETGNRDYSVIADASVPSLDLCSHPRRTHRSGTSRGVPCVVRPERRGGLTDSHCASTTGSGSPPRRR